MNDEKLIGQVIEKEFEKISQYNGFNNQTAKRICRKVCRRLIIELKKRDDLPVTNPPLNNEDGTKNKNL
jgi:Holliday junction resolvasome RuvABC DNA-binding subunit